MFGSVYNKLFGRNKGSSIKVKLYVVCDGTGESPMFCIMPNRIGQHDGNDGLVPYDEVSIGSIKIREDTKWENLKPMISDKFQKFVDSKRVYSQLGLSSDAIRGFRIANRDYTNLLDTGDNNMAAESVFAEEEETPTSGLVTIQALQPAPCRIGRTGVRSRTMSKSNKSKIEGTPGDLSPGEQGHAEKHEFGPDTYQAANEDEAEQQLKQGAVAALQEDNDPRFDKKNAETVEGIELTERIPRTFTTAPVVVPPERRVRRFGVVSRKPMTIGDGSPMEYFKRKDLRKIKVYLKGARQDKALDALSFQIQLPISILERDIERLEEKGLIVYCGPKTIGRNIEVGKAAKKIGEYLLTRDRAECVVRYHVAVYNPLQSKRGAFTNLRDFMREVHRRCDKDIDDAGISLITAGGLELYIPRFRAGCRLGTSPYIVVIENLHVLTNDLKDITDAMRDFKNCLPRIRYVIGTCVRSPLDFFH